MQLKPIQLPEYVVNQQARFIEQAEAGAYSQFSRLSEGQLSRDNNYLESARIMTGAKSEGSGKLYPEYVNLDLAVTHGHFVAYRRSLELVGDNGQKEKIEITDPQLELILPAQVRYQNAQGKARQLIREAIVDAIESAVRGPTVDRDESVEIIAQELHRRSIPFTADLSELPPGLQRVSFFPILDFGALVALTGKLPGKIERLLDENAMVFFDSQYLHVFREADSLAA